MYFYGFRRKSNRLTVPKEAIEGRFETELRRCGGKPMKQPKTMRFRTVRGKPTLRSRAKTEESNARTGGVTNNSDYSIFSRNTAATIARGLTGK